jgi:hypothetical protein
MSKAFEERMKDFVKAGYELSKMWDGLTQEESEAITLKSYPFAEDFQEVIADLGEWAQEALEGLEKLRTIDKLKRVHYCMSRENNDYTEPFWFFECKLVGGQHGGLMLEDETGGCQPRFIVKIEEFEENFIAVNEEAYKLYIMLNAHGLHSEVQDVVRLVEQIGGLIEDYE